MCFWCQQPPGYSELETRNPRGVQNEYTQEKHLELYKHKLLPSMCLEFPLYLVLSESYPIKVIVSEVKHLCYLKLTSCT